MRSPVPDEDSEDDEEYYSKLFGCNFRLNMGRTPTPDECASDDEVQLSLFITHLIILTWILVLHGFVMSVIFLIMELNTKYM